MKLLVITGRKLFMKNRKSKTDAARSEKRCSFSFYCKQNSICESISFAAGNHITKNVLCAARSPALRAAVRRNRV